MFGRNQGQAITKATGVLKGKKVKRPNIEISLLIPAHREKEGKRGRNSWTGRKGMVLAEFKVTEGFKCCKKTKR